MSTVLIPSSEAVMKTILITGAGRRLGKDLAEYWLAQGWRVLAHYNTANELESHKRLMSFQADLSSADSVLGLCEQLNDWFRANGTQLDGLVHNASCFVPDAVVGDRLRDHAEHVQKHLHVHVGAPYLLMEALKEHWANQAAVVAISDIYSDIPNQRFAAYCSSKAGLQNLALSQAQRLAGKVRVNVIQPGPVKFLPEHSEAYRQQVLSQSLIREELGYEAIIDACAYLMNARALTGTVMRVDGGRFVTNRYDQTFVNQTS